MLDKDTGKKKVKILIADPLGFCGGVSRAIEMTELALKKFGTPLYANHDIVHNKILMDHFKELGVIFVDDILNIQPGSNLLLSAHGSSKKIIAQAQERSLNIIDTTCPLVSSVHDMAQNLEKVDYSIILIGHPEHIEVIGTIGQVDCEVILIQNIEDVDKIEVKDSNKVGYITQTTLNIDEVKDIIDALKKKFPKIIGPRKGNICYATKNRQDIAKKVSKDVDLMIVVGSSHSSNSNRLRDVCSEYTKSYLVDYKEDLKEDWLYNVSSIGITAGASAPQSAVNDIIDFLKEYFDNIEIETIRGAEEDTVFSIPKTLLED